MCRSQNRDHDIFLCVLHPQMRSSRRRAAPRSGAGAADESEQNDRIDDETLNARLDAMLRSYDSVGVSDPGPVLPVPGASVLPTPYDSAADSGSLLSSRMTTATSSARVSSIGTASGSSSIAVTRPTIPSLLASNTDRATSGTNASSFLNRSAQSSTTPATASLLSASAATTSTRTSTPTSGSGTAHRPRSRSRSPSRLGGLVRSPEHQRRLDEILAQTTTGAAARVRPDPSSGSVAGSLGWWIAAAIAINVLIVVMFWQSNPTPPAVGVPYMSHTFKHIAPDRTLSDSFPEAQEYLATLSPTTLASTSAGKVNEQVWRELSAYLDEAESTLTQAIVGATRKDADDSPNASQVTSTSVVAMKQAFSLIQRAHTHVQNLHTSARISAAQYVILAQSNAVTEDKLKSLEDAYATLERQTREQKAEEVVQVQHQCEQTTAQLQQQCQKSIATVQAQLEQSLKENADACKASIDEMEARVAELKQIAEVTCEEKLKASEAKCADAVKVGEKAAADKESALLEEIAHIKQQLLAASEASQGKPGCDESSQLQVTELKAELEGLKQQLVDAAKQHSEKEQELKQQLVEKEKQLADKQLHQQQQQPDGTVPTDCISEEEAEERVRKALEKVKQTHAREMTLATTKAAVDATSQTIKMLRNEIAANVTAESEKIISEHKANFTMQVIRLQERLQLCETAVAEAAKPKIDGKKDGSNAESTTEEDESCEARIEKAERRAAEAATEAANEEILLATKLAVEGALAPKEEEIAELRTQLEALQATLAQYNSTTANATRALDVNATVSAETECEKRVEKAVLECSIESAKEISEISSKASELEKQLEIAQRESEKKAESITQLNVQIEKLTEERDELKEHLDAHHKEGHEHASVLEFDCTAKCAESLPTNKDAESPNQALLSCDEERKQLQVDFDKLLLNWTAMATTLETMNATLLNVTSAPPPPCVYNDEVADEIEEINARTLSAEMTALSHQQSIKEMQQAVEGLSRASFAQFTDDLQSLTNNVRTITTIMRRIANGEPLDPSMLHSADTKVAENALCPCARKFCEQLVDARKEELISLCPCEHHSYRRGSGRKTNLLNLIHNDPIYAYLFSTDTSHNVGSHLSMSVLTIAKLFLWILLDVFIIQLVTPTQSRMLTFILAGCWSALAWQCLLQQSYFLLVICVTNALLGLLFTCKPRLALRYTVVDDCVTFVESQ